MTNQPIPAEPQAEAEVSTWHQRSEGAWFDCWHCWRYDDHQHEHCNRSEPCAACREAGRTPEKF